MGKGLLFFCCSCCILVLTIINLSVGPIVSGTLGDDWGLENCEKLKDDKDKKEDQYKATNQDFPDEEDKNYQSHIDACIRKKAMYNMEYTAFIFDIVIGFICSLIGLLHIFDIKKDFVSNTGLIGLICGIIGFILTFVYVLFNGIVFTSKYSNVLERDGDGIFATYDTSANNYKCINFDKEYYYWGYAKFSDLNKKQYNYKHNFYDNAALECVDDRSFADLCKGDKHLIDEFFAPNVNSGYSNDPSICKNIYAIAEVKFENKDKFDRFLTALILSLVVCLANIGLALFGFLLFRTPGDF